MARPTLFLIDGSSQMYRAYHAFRGRGLSNQEGHTTHAVYVFVTMLRKLMSDHQPRYIAASFDLAGPTFRDTLVADKIKNPLLIMHGAEDANPGTTPLQATKLYEAVRGTGGVARLVMLPYEPHWYSAMESNEQLAFEELRWFDTHVKNAGPKSTKPAKDAPKKDAKPATQAKAAP